MPSATGGRGDDELPGRWVGWGVGARLVAIAS